MDQHGDRIAHEGVVINDIDGHGFKSELNLKYEDNSKLHHTAIII
jgi:hypothetical protein